MPERRPPLLPAHHIATRLLARARRQHRGEFAQRKLVRSGLPSLDALAPSWWGLTILAGESQTGRTTLAARVALETAREGGRVVWLEQGGSVDTPVFRLLTGLARVPARRVFVERTLEGEAWGALEGAAAELGRLPIALAEAHGATIEDLRRAVAAGRSEGPMELAVVDGVGAPDRRYLRGLEALADELEVPVLAVVTIAAEADWQREAALLRGELPQRPGSLRLRLSKEEPEDDEPAKEPACRWLDVHRAGEGFRRAIALDLDTRCRWIEEAAESVSVDPAPCRS